MGGQCEQRTLQPPGDWGLTPPDAGKGTGTASAAGNSAGGRCDNCSGDDDIEAADNQAGDQPTLQGKVKKPGLLEASNCMAELRFL